MIARQSSAPGSIGDSLDESEVHDVLRNERRRMLLSILVDGPGAHTLREISERIAERESGTTPAPRDVRQSVYVSLQQTHIPKLHDLGVIEFDRDANEVSLSEHADDVTVYLEVVPRYGLAWSEYYLGVGLLGLLTVVSAVVGVPVVSRVSPSAWAVSFLAVVVASSVYHTWRLGSTVLHRTRDN